ncbi:hypothetical protein [Haloferax massiliensis]|uniref:DUF8203 domain-containing protein n=1 Tax=Haloferax massiliensis TaxID=1476858 RepID=A0A0D6JWP3_9EURY|nr:hypothetical protein [Haloferax massiliensis]CQR53865.1 hypothetical protein BN996_03839 [Haloferax massiliensis]
MSSDGIIAADATKNEFHKQHPHGVNVVSVAIAVGDHQKFNEKYFEIIKEKIEKYDIKLPHPILKSKDISRHIPTWQTEEARKDIVFELLSIDVLDTIYVTETYLKPKWIELYSDEEDEFRRMTSHDFVKDILFQYYDIVSIWKYLERYHGGDGTHYNVMTDYFSGQVCRAYQELGELADNFLIVPQGDQTYPVLSMADLVTGLLKQEVYPLRKDEIEEYIKDETPGYVVADSVYDGKDLERLVPHVTDGIRTDLNLPDPTVYIARGDVPKDRVTSLDMFHHACMYAQIKGGSVKFFEENNDRHHFSGEDILVCVDGNSEIYADYERLNTQYSITVFDAESAINHFLDEIPSGLVL